MPWVCIAAAVRRGVVDQQKPLRMGFPVGLLRPGFSFIWPWPMGGANSEADHAVTFVNGRCAHRVGFTQTPVANASAREGVKRSSLCGF